MCYVRSECVIASLFKFQFLATKGGKSRKIDPDTLTCSHHRAMIAALKHWHGGFEELFSEKMNFCVLGLGGGLLAKFLYEKFPKVGIFSQNFGCMLKNQVDPMILS